MILSDEEKLLRLKPQSSPAANTVCIHPVQNQSILTEMCTCLFSPAEAPEPKWMNANAAFYLLKMSHPVTVPAAPPEKAA